MPITGRGDFPLRTAWGSPRKGLNYRIRPGKILTIAVRPAYSSIWSDWFFDAASGSTTVTITTPTVTYTPRSIFVNAKRFVTVVTPSETYTPRAITVNAKTFRAVTAGTITYSGVALTVNAKTFKGVTPVSIAYTALPVTVNAKTSIVITKAQENYAPASISVTISSVGGIKPYQKLSYSLKYSTT